MKDPVLLRLRRRLDRQALEQLREVAADLQERLELAEARAVRAEDDAEFWREQADRLSEALQDSAFTTHRCVGLTQDGSLVVVEQPEARAS